MGPIPTFVSPAAKWESVKCSGREPLIDRHPPQLPGTGADRLPGSFCSRDRKSISVARRTIPGRLEGELLEDYELYVSRQR